MKTLLAVLSAAVLVAPVFAQTEPGVSEVPNVGSVTRQIRGQLDAQRAARAAAPAQAAEPDSIKACALHEEAFSYNLKRVSDAGSGFVFFLTKTHGNAFQLCVNRDQSIFFQGLPIWGRAILDAQNLIVESVTTGGSVSMIPADEVEKGQVAGAEYRVPERPAYAIGSRTIYYLERSKLSHEAIAATGNNTVYADEAAWLSFVLDPRTKEARILQARIKDTDPVKAEAAIRKAFTIGSAARSAWGESASLTAIVDHVKRELPKYDGQNKPLIRKPMIEVNLFARREAQTLEPVVVVDIRAAGRQAGVDDRGEPIISAESYDQLLYCYARSRLESRTEHNRHLSR